MSKLKKETLNKCFSLLGEYIANGPETSQNEIARLALTQLREITAGEDAVLLDLSCNGKPRANEDPELVIE